MSGSIARRIRTWATALVAVAGAATMQANADTLYVNGSCGNDAWSGTNSVCSTPNGPKLTIQAGISASITGDTVVVADGTYIGADNKNLDFGGRLITLRSENGPADCIIDCENDGRGVYFHNGETGDAVLEGFTIRDGNVGIADGGGILCESASPTILNCVLLNNRASGGGGGMSIVDSNPVVTNCTFIGNAAPYGPGSFGGGMLNAYSNTTVTNCTFSGNSTEGDGGGMWNLFSSPTLVDCTFSGNFAIGDVFSSGGGMAGEVSSPTVTHCTFTGNSAGDRGGGLFSWEGSDTLTNCLFRGNSAVSGGAMYNSGNGNATVNNCTFSENSAEDDGGGMFNANGTPTVTNCTFSRNSAAGDGGGMYNLGGTPTVTNCTFSANSAEGDGGGMYNGNGHRRPIVTNCILWNDIPDEVVDSLGPPSTVRFSDVQGGWKGQGNVDADPLFVDPGNDDYRLAPGSPCIDAADNAAVPPGITTDRDGNPRFVDDPATPDCQWDPGTCGDPPIVDMGAYEFQVDCDSCDMNCDGGVNAFDIEPFLDLLFGPGEPCAPCTGDANGDGNIDAFDIEPFLACLFP